jgi:hypothetical protein
VLRNLKSSLGSVQVQGDRKYISVYPESLAS